MVKICTIRHSIISDGKCMQISCCDEDWWTDTKTIRRDLSALVRFNRVDRWQEYLALLVVRRVSVTTRVNEMNQSGKRRSKQSRRHSSASTTSDNGRVSLLEGGGTIDGCIVHDWRVDCLGKKTNAVSVCVSLSLSLCSTLTIGGNYRRRLLCGGRPAPSSQRFASPENRLDGALHGPNLPLAEDQRRPTHSGAPARHPHIFFLSPFTTEQDDPK